MGQQAGKLLANVNIRAYFWAQQAGKLLANPNIEACLVEALNLNHILSKAIAQ